VPRSTPSSNLTGALRDPAGNVFGVYEHHH
jgi:hypothetical protein